MCVSSYIIAIESGLYVPLIRGKFYIYDLIKLFQVRLMIESKKSIDKNSYLQSFLIVKIANT